MLGLALSPTEEVRRDTMTENGLFGSTGLTVPTDGAPASRVMASARQVCRPARGPLLSDGDRPLFMLMLLVLGHADVAARAILEPARTLPTPCPLAASFSMSIRKAHPANQKRELFHDDPHRGGYFHLRFARLAQTRSGQTVAGP